MDIKWSKFYVVLSVRVIVRKAELAYGLDSHFIRPFTALIHYSVLTSLVNHLGVLKPNDIKDGKISYYLSSI